MKFANQMILSSVDYPGQMCYTLFTIGCNLRCEYCHNIELVNCDLGSTIQIVDKLKKQQHNTNCVTITGGEPTLQKHLLQFCSLLKAEGFNIKLDTNGLNPDVLYRLLENDVIDYFAMDIKTHHMCYITPRLLGTNNSCLAHFNGANYTTGLTRYEVSLVLSKRIKRSIELLRDSNILHEYRTTPTIDICSKDNFVSIANYLSYMYKTNPTKPMWYIQTTKQPHGVEWSGINLYTENELDEIVDDLSLNHYSDTKYRKR